MVKYGLRPDQVVQVRGYADRNLRKPSQPFDASNRRVTVLIQYMPDNPQSIVVTGKGPLPNIK
jgi:chemotaxis protein MotB